MLKILSLPLMATAFLFMSGCALIYKPTGHVLTSLAQDKVVPYVLASGDLRLTTCGTGLSQNQLIGAFTLVNGRPAKTMIDLNTLAALCSEMKAQEAQVNFQQALGAGNTDEARNLRIQGQRLHRVTALRRFQVYKDTVTAYGELGDGECPDLGGDIDQAQYMVGVLTSVQALLSDIQANSSVGVPTDVAARSARAAQCLDNDKWWGVPAALQGVVWLSVPGALPEGKDAWTTLEQAADLGASKGMPLAAMLYVIAGYGQSDIARQKEGIRQVARIYNNGVGPTDYLLLAEVAFDQAQYYSDRIWIDETGHRTPFLGLGGFPGDEESEDADFDASEFLN